MGHETKCRVRVDDGSGTVRDADDATVLIETDDLIVRGTARIKVPRASIESVTARDGTVTITSPAAVVTLMLGDAAERWRARLMEPPKRLIDKLDVKPDATVWLHHVDDEMLIAQLRQRTSKLTSGRSAEGCDVVFVGVDRVEQLDRLARAVEATHEDGAVWVIHPKGPSGVADTAIFDRATSIGLTYVKVARVSETHTAEKLVRPRAGRRR